jgi:predicted nucleotidyltransferase component of viral defense system
MASSVRSKLGEFQTAVLEAFFRRESRFFLTGGAALAGFHLGHRTTEDLDLFTTSEVLEDGELALNAVARELGATVEGLRTAPDFRRRLLRRGSEGLVVDLVLDRAPQGAAEKAVIGGIRMDPPEEILANKLCALLSRSEYRDIVDVQALEKAGFSVEDALPIAMSKDAGLTPGQLAWVLSLIEVDDQTELPGHVSIQSLREYLVDLQKRLSRFAFPQ